MIRKAKIHKFKSGATVVMWRNQLYTNRKKVALKIIVTIISELHKLFNKK